MRQTFLREQPFFNFSFANIFKQITATTYIKIPNNVTRTALQGIAQIIENPISYPTDFPLSRQCIIWLVTLCYIKWQSYK